MTSFPGEESRRESNKDTLIFEKCAKQKNFKKRLKVKIWKELKISFSVSVRIKIMVNDLYKIA